MSIFETGEEVICVDADRSDGQLRKGRTYIVLDQSPICECCIHVGIHMWCSEQRFRRPRTDEQAIGSEELIWRVINVTVANRA